jgi:hypothetical protein
MTALGRAAEMLLLGKGHDVAEFGEGHGRGSWLQAGRASNLRHWGHIRTWCPRTSRSTGLR